MEEQQDLKKPVRFALKIIITYLLLVGALIGAIYLIMRVTDRLVAPNTENAEMMQKRSAMNNLMNDLYQMELISGTVIRGQFDEMPRYRQVINRTHNDIRLLKKLFNDSTQRLRLDSISYLIRQKDRKMAAVLSVVRQQDSNNKDFLSELKRVINAQDTVQPPRHIKNVVVRTNTIQKVDTVKQNFFQKLKNLFRRTRPDTTQVVTEQVETAVDTVINPYSAGDTVVHILTNVRNKLLKSHASNFVSLADKSKQLQLSGLEISHKLNSLFKSIEEEDMRNVNARQEVGKVLRTKSVRTLSWIAIGAVALAAVFMAFIGRDLLLENRYRREIEKARRKALDLLSARERLMLTITHDIKAPAGSVLGYSDLLFRLVKDERQKFYIENLRNSAKHLLSLVSSLLDFHRLDANKMDVNVVAFNPYKLFDEIYNSFLPLAEQKQLVFKYDYTDSMDTTAQGDPFRIRQIAENFLTNALKFTKEGEIRLKCSYLNGVLNFAVQDTGCGISEEDKDKIFSEFTRLSNAQGEEGFGLGLAITLKLVQLLNGAIDVQSELGKGSCFSVQLPVEGAPSAAVTSEDEATASAEEHDFVVRKLNVLMIDDDRIQLDLTKALLERLNISITCCEYPEDLLTYLKNETFDVLFTDIQMPAMNGFELVQYLRNSSVAQAQTIPVVALTARGDITYDSLKERGFSGCLHKPFSQQDVIRLFRQVLHVDVKEDATDTSVSSGPATTTASDKVDFSSLSAFSGGDDGAVRNILKTFVEETEKNVEFLKKSAEQKDIRSVAAAAHKMLPLFRLLKVQGCVTPLASLEQERDKTDFTEKDAENVETALQQVAGVMEQTEAYLANL